MLQGGTWYFIVRSAEHFFLDRDVEQPRLNVREVSQKRVLKVVKLYTLAESQRSIVVHYEDVVFETEKSSAQHISCSPERRSKKKKSPVICSRITRDETN
jgi:uncharacterized protein (DUF58 family)